MRIGIIIVLFFCLAGCSTHKPEWNCIRIQPGSFEANDFLSLIDRHQFDTTKTVEIYSYRLDKKARIIDSALVIVHKINDTGYHDHTSYKVVYDSLGRDFERYATRIATNETHLNYRNEYNAKNQKVRWTVFNDDGKINSETLYYYSTEGALWCEEKWFGHFVYSQPELEQTKNYYYTNGYLERVRTEDEYGQTNEQFNPYGQLMFSRHDYKGADGKVYFYSTRYSYDGKKLISKIEETAVNGSSQTTYKYNTKSIPIEQITKYGNSTALLRYFIR